MNPDGTGLVRLTTDAAYDGQPAWSPDGTRLAFSSDRGGNYHIWVMNADGSSPVQLSTQNYSSNATWSLDGTRIAYSADGNNYSWSEIWSDERRWLESDPLFRSPGYEPIPTSCVRSWSPDAAVDCLYDGSPGCIPITSGIGAPAYLW